MNAPDMLRAAIGLEGRSQAWLARETGLTAKHINQICQGKDPISVHVAILLEMALPSLSAEDLLCAQVRDQLWTARIARVLG
jgi:plasmid maintenance system antidote protein VapI